MRLSLGAAYAALLVFLLMLLGVLPWDATRRKA